MNSIMQSNQPGWYHRLSNFFKSKFGEPVYKIPLDAGFFCPNLDGKIGTEGCSYCYNPSFAPMAGINKAQGNPYPITEQLNKGLKKKKEAKYLAYFQAYSNTYAPVAELKAVYDEALQHPAVVGLSIATRPDCLTEEILKLLTGYGQNHHLWVEYGLQSSHDRTLEIINRGHDVAVFSRAVNKTRGRGIYICAHIILGLPGETREMMLETISYLNHLGVDGVKFHHLQVIQNTALAKRYFEQQFPVFDDEDQYINILCDCLERLAPHIVVHRLASQVNSSELLIAPRWSKGPGEIAARVEAELRNRGTYQGYHTGDLT